MAHDDTEGALVTEVLETYSSPNRPGLGDQKRDNTLNQSEISQWVSSLNDKYAISKDTEKFLRALMLLWNDFLEPSHSIVQEMGHPEASYIHGMMHRREGDFGNAKYWFRRAYPLENQGQFDSLVEKYTLELGETISGVWDPAGFVDRCQADMNNPKSEKIQVAEFMAISHYVISNN